MTLRENKEEAQQTFKALASFVRVARSERVNDSNPTR